MAEKTEWTLESILALLTPIFPDVICGEDDNGQFTIWTGFYKDGEPKPKVKVVMTIPKDQINGPMYNWLDDFRL